MNSHKQILKILAKTYPNPTTELNHDSPFQLLIATILSAQCTDKRVNIITSKLFHDHPTLISMDTVPLKDLEEYIKTAGLWKSKAKNIKKTCRILMEKHHGEVPKTREELMELPGVGRKTANVVLANAFQIPTIAVDTHVQRVANRLGLVKSKNPVQTENQLMQVIPKQDWINAHHWLILHGRRVCKARTPLCHLCPLLEHCPSANL